MWQRRLSEKWNLQLGVKGGLFSFKTHGCSKSHDWTHGQDCTSTSNKPSQRQGQLKWLFPGKSVHPWQWLLNSTKPTLFFVYNCRKTGRWRQGNAGGVNAHPDNGGASCGLAEVPRHGNQHFLKGIISWSDVRPLQRVIFHYYITFFPTTRLQQFKPPSFKPKVTLGEGLKTRP